jgi:hypothetical protein
MTHGHKDGPRGDIVGGMRLEKVRRKYRVVLIEQVKQAA